jgi:hypothetical protein
MRTTIEIKPEHRAKLLELAARRGQKGFSQLIAEALEAFLKAQTGQSTVRKRALTLRGALDSKEAKGLRAVTAEIRASWR